MSANKGNFGINNTSAAGKCNAIFQEAKGKSCLSNPTLCDGGCLEFTKTTCSLPMYDKFVYGTVTSEPVATPVNKDSAPPHALASNPESSQNMIPIIVASFVSAFVVFGMAGIIWHRKRKGKGGGGGGGSGRNPFKKSSSAQDDDLDDAYDGLDDMDEEVY